MSARRFLTIDQYQVGIICALHQELAAAMAILDERHQQMTGQDKLDENNYVLGRVHEHNVVIACLPAGVYGTNSAARVARDMVRTFTGLRFGLMIGIGGGIPNLQKSLDIRLGDVVISQPDQIHGGVVQYDIGKNLRDGHFERKSFLRPPPTVLLAALATLRADHELNDSQVPNIMAKMYQQHSNLTRHGYGFPGRENDDLYCSKCGGSSSSSCDLCTDGKIERLARESQHPAFWYGVIASGNQLIKNAAARDRIGRELGAFCVETEAAGLMNDFPCIVVRGICDYADSHKNDAWQNYAALAATAYAKEFLACISPNQTSHEKPVQEIVYFLDQQSRLMKEHLKETKRENEEQDQRYQSSKDRDCHQALKTSRYEQFKDVNPDRMEGTCQWVLSHPQYRYWATKDYDDLLWVSADPGCGKSVLAKSLIDNELRATDEHTVCYFFFRDNDEQDKLATALCALLHQLISYRPQLTRYIMPAWERSGPKLVEETRELWRILLIAAKSDVAHDVTCVLDALDECRPTDRQLLIDMLARFYTLISPSTSTARRGRLRFLVTSRPYDDIRTEFQKTLDDLPTIRLRGEEENDKIHQEIDLVIQKRVEKLAKNLKLDVQTKNKLEVRLLEMQHRTYLWLHLAIEGIYETFRDSIRPKEASIEPLPSTVDDAYEKILTRVSENQRGTVKKILQIVVGARRALTIQEMAIALGLATVTHPTSIHDVQLPPDHLENNIRHWCGLFIFINHTRIYLIHQTAKEFLVCNSGPATFPSGWKNCLDPREIENEMTRICIEFLCLEDSRPVAEFLVQKFQRELRIDELLDEGNHAESFLAYTAESWPYHFRETDIPTNELVIAQMSKFYKTDSTLYRLWFAIYWRATILDEAEPQLNSIRLAAVLGHRKMLEWMLQLDQHCDVNESDEAGRVALTWASRFGHDKTVETLLDWGADVNLQGGDHGNALYIASMKGHEKVVELLLNKGADVNSQGKGHGSALQVALAHDHEKVAELLLDWGADVNSQGKGYPSALQVALCRGREKIMELLLDKGANINSQGKGHDSALLTASRHGHEKVVEFLLNRGACPNWKDKSGRTALLWAAAMGKLGVVKMLLGRENVDRRSQDLYGQNPLLLAAGNGHEAVVKLLIAQDLDSLFSNDNFGRTPLSWASKRGHSKIVQLIHEKYQEKGMIIRDEDLNLATPPASNQECRKYCSICLSDIPDVNIHHHCGICDDGDFDICPDCLLVGAFCLDHSHKLIKCTFKDHELVELVV